MHLLKSLSELLHLFGSEMRLDNPSCGKIKSLDGFLPVPDRNTDNFLRFRDQSLRIGGTDSLEVSFWDSDTDKSSSEPKKIHSPEYANSRQQFHLGMCFDKDMSFTRQDSHRVGRIGSCENDHGVRSMSSCQIHHLLGHVFTSGKIDEMLGAGLEDDVLLASIIDADNPKAHTTRRNLHCKVAKAYRYVRLDYIGVP